MPSSVLTRELDAERGIAPLRDVIRKLRDEVAAINFEATRGHSRYWSMVVAKLEEAEGLAILADREHSHVAIVDRAKVLQAAFAERGHQ